jgi:hypothetical protein
MKLVFFNLDFGQISAILTTMVFFAVFKLTQDSPTWGLLAGGATYVLLNYLPIGYIQGGYFPGFPVHLFEKIEMELVDENKNPFDLDIQDWQHIPDFLKIFNQIFKTDSMARKVIDEVKEEAKVSAPQPTSLRVMPIQFEEAVKKCLEERGLVFDDSVAIDAILATQKDPPTLGKVLIAFYRGDKDLNFYDYLTTPEGFLIKTRRIRGGTIITGKIGEMEPTGPTDLTFDTPQGTIKCSEAYFLIPPHPQPVPPGDLNSFKFNASLFSVLRAVGLTMLSGMWSMSNLLTKAEAALRQNETLVDINSTQTGDNFSLAQGLFVSYWLSTEEILAGRQLPVPKRGLLPHISQAVLIVGFCMVLGALIGAFQPIYLALGYPQTQTMIGGGILGFVAGIIIAKLSGAE